MEGERQRERERQRETERQTERDRETDRHTDRQRGIERGRDRQRKLVLMFNAQSPAVTSPTWTTRLTTGCGARSAIHCGTTCTSSSDC